MRHFLPAIGAGIGRQVVPQRGLRHGQRMRQAARPVLEPGRVHTISSISAMVQLVQGGFGVATLPLKAVRRMQNYPFLRPLACTSKLQPLPIHASYRTDPTNDAIETVLKSALAFVEMEFKTKKSPASAPTRRAAPRS